MVNDWVTALMFLHIIYVSTFAPLNIQTTWYHHFGREESFNFVYLIVLFFVCWCWGIVKLLAKHIYIIAKKVCRVVFIEIFITPCLHQKLRILQCKIIKLKQLNINKYHKPLGQN